MVFVREVRAYMCLRRVLILEDVYLVKIRYATFF